eukprot:scaffold248380_cov51-Cyclotella_meneghiniana.AAC.2
MGVGNLQLLAMYHGNIEPSLSSWAIPCLILSWLNVYMLQVFEGNKTDGTRAVGLQDCSQKN